MRVTLSGWLSRPSKMDIERLTSPPNIACIVRFRNRFAHASSHAQSARSERGSTCSTDGVLCTCTCTCAPLTRPWARQAPFGPTQASDGACMPEDEGGRRSVCTRSGHRVALHREEVDVRRGGVEPEDPHRLPRPSAG